MDPNCLVTLERTSREVGTFPVVGRILRGEMGEEEEGNDPVHVRKVGRIYNVQVVQHHPW